MKINKRDTIEYLTFDSFDRCNYLKHLFTTRKGGVSSGIYESMNLSYSRGDDKECVDENFKRIADLFETSPEYIVCGAQTHTSNIKIVTKLDAGAGVTRKTPYQDIDGLITNEKDIVLCTSHADCTPVFFTDPVHKIIGLAHSGWRGTAERIGEKMVQFMCREYGSDPKDILCGIGPCICGDCYEVSWDVARFFTEYSNPSVLKKSKVPEKYQLDLKLANQEILLNAGILKEHIEITDFCTACHSEYLFSHRASGGKRGNCCAFIKLNESS